MKQKTRPEENKQKIKKHGENPGKFLRKIKDGFSFARYNLETERQGRVPALKPESGKEQHMDVENKDGAFGGGEAPSGGMGGGMPGGN